MKRLGLRAKFIILISAVLTAIFALSAVVAIRFTTATLRNNLTNQSRAFANLATDPIGNAFVLYQNSGRVRILQQIQKFTDLDPNINNVQVVNTTGKTLFSQNEQMAGVEPAVASSFDIVYQNDAGGLPRRIVAPYVENFGAHRYSVVYDISTKEIEQTVDRVAASTLALSTLGLVFTGWLLYLAVNRFLLKPIQLLSGTALIISKGQLDKEIAINSRDELADLATSVNTMADSLKADIAKLQEVDQLKSEFMMIASHNLRTPLSIIRGYLETMAHYQLTREVAKMVEIVSANTERLHLLAEDILTISQFETNQTLDQSKQAVNLNSLLASIGAEFAVLAKQKQIEFRTNLAEQSLSINASESYLRSAIGNLLDNAIKFTKPGGKVGLGLTSEADSAAITVVDSGIGIAPAEMQKLFTKFHRGTSTLEYNYEGAGIGLYISKLIIKQYGGEITASSELAKGSKFKITLPLSSGQT